MGSPVLANRLGRYRAHPGGVAWPVPRPLALRSSRVIQARRANLGSIDSRSNGRRYRNSPELERAQRAPPPTARRLLRRSVALLVRGTERSFRLEWAKEQRGDHQVRDYLEASRFSRDQSSGCLPIGQILASFSRTSWPIKRENGIDALEDEHRRRQIEHCGRSDPERLCPPRGPGARRRDHCTALHCEKKYLPTLNATGGDTKYIFMDEARHSERDESRANGSAQSPRRHENIHAQELLSGAIPAPPEICRRPGSDRIVHKVERPASQESICGC
jgi:hypothetical protein